MAGIRATQAYVTRGGDRRARPSSERPLAWFARIRYDSGDASRGQARRVGWVGGVSSQRPEAPGRAGAPAAIKLSPTSYLVLGMVRLGVSSGYAIKKIADQSTQNFWPTSLGLIYPELARLEEGGLLDRRSNPHGGRARSAYTITERGEAALSAWLRAEKVAAVQIRDEAMLKLFMADALAEPAEQLELIQRLRERNREKKTALREEIVPQAERFESQGIRYIAVAARLSADLLGFAESWLEGLAEELEAEEAGRVQSNSRPAVEDSSQGFGRVSTEQPRDAGNPYA